MATLRSIILNVWIQRVALTLVGAGVGYWYYAAIGCERGCAITSDPWISTAYGALVGFLAHPARFRSTRPADTNGETS